MPPRIPTYKPPGARPQNSDRDRKNSAARGYDHRWREYRRVFLRNNPLCVKCADKGIVRMATQVDHITPVKGGQADPAFWLESNHQPLCASCHSSKTSAELRKARGSQGK